MSALRTRIAVAAAGILLAVGTLSGCANTPPDLQASTAASLQLGVLDVTNAAKSGDYAGAQATLTTLQADLLTAAAADQISAARVAQVQNAINAVSSDLAKALAAQADAATPSPPPTSGNSSGSGNENGGGDGAATPSSTQAPAPAPAPVTTAPADDKKGGDDGKGKDDPCKGKDKKDC